MVCAVLGLYTLSWCWYKYAEIRDELFGLGPTEQVLPEDGERIQSPKRCVLKYEQDGVLNKRGRWIMSRNIIFGIRIIKYGCKCQSVESCMYTEGCF
jgi:hypothetical protein